MEAQKVPSNLDLYPGYYDYMKKVVAEKNGCTFENEDDSTQEKTETPSDSSSDDN